MLLSTLSALRERTDSVIVAVSRGKDSLALLDLACRHFSRVEAFCMHVVAGLSFVENYLAYLERRYHVTIDRVPHWWLSHAFRQGTYRPLTRSCPKITIRDVQEAQRRRTGLHWFLSGEKACDSLQRRGMLNSMAGGKFMPAIDDRAGVCYPLAWWTDRQVYAYLKTRQIPLPADYRILGRSFSTQLDGKTLSLLAEHYHDDIAKIEEVFPFCRAAILQHRLARSRADRSDSRASTPAPPPDVPGGTLGT